MRDAFGDFSYWFEADADSQETKVARMFAPFVDERSRLTGAPPPLSEFQGGEALKGWVQELKAARRTKANAAAWRLIGHAAIIQFPDAEIGNQLCWRLAREAGFGFISLSEGLPGHPSFNLTMLQDAAPVLVYLEASDWMNDGHDGNQPPAVADLRAALRRATLHFAPSSPVVFVTVARDAANFCKELRVAGGFDRQFALPEVADEVYGRWFVAGVGNDVCADSVHAHLADIGYLLDQGVTTRQRDLWRVYLQRIAHLERRKIEYQDIIEASLAGLMEHGTVSLPTEELRRRVAVHEAGHVLLAVVDSNGENVPELATIRPRSNSSGCVSDAIAYLRAHERDTTFGHLRRRIRAHLGGRAAEEVVLGKNGVGDGAQSDLKRATQKAWEAVDRHGFGGLIQGGDEVLTLDTIANNVGSVTSAHFESLSRRLLSDEYKVALETVRTHRPLLDRYVAELLQRGTVYRDELAAVWHGYLAQRARAPATRRPFAPCASSTASGSPAPSGPPSPCTTSTRSPNASAST